MRKKLTVILVALFIAILCTAVFSACGGIGSGGSNKCYYEISEQFPDHITNVSIETSVMSSDDKGSYIEKGADFRFVIETDNIYYNGSALKVVINGTSYDVAANGESDTYYKTAWMKAESDMKISVTGEVTEVTGNFTFDCPTDDELTEYCDSSYMSQISEAQKSEITIKFDNYDMLAALNPDIFGSGKTFAKQSYSYKEYQKLFADGPVTVTAGKSNGVRMSISFEELSGYETFYVDSFKFIKDEQGYVSTPMFSNPAYATVSESNAARTVKYEYALWGFDDEGASYPNEDIEIFAPFISVRDFISFPIGIISNFSYNGLDTNFFDYDNETRTVSRTNHTENLDEVYAATTLTVNETELGKFDAKSYTLDKKPYEYYKNWNGRRLGYNDYNCYEFSSDFVEQAYAKSKGITYEEFTQRFVSVTGEYELKGTMSVNVGTATNSTEYASFATVDFLEQDSFTLNDEQIFFFVYDCTYTLNFKGPSDSLNLAVGSTIKITMNDTAYTYTLTTLQSESGDSYYRDWICENGPKLSIGILGGTDNDWQISGIPVQYVPTSIEFNIVTE